VQLLKHRLFETAYILHLPLLLLSSSARPRLLYR
jgi:hypothetical protein